MSFIDFAGYAGLILAIAAALDIVTKDTVKQSLANRMMAAAANSANGFQGSEAANRFFGVSLLSRKAVTRYSFLSLFSLVLTYGFAYVTTPVSEQGDIVSIFQGKITALDVFIFSFSLLSAIIADILSYSQTRIFLGAVDRYKSSVVSLGLVIADGLISVGLFLLCFSVARFSAAALVMSSIPGPDITLITYYQPEIIEQFMGNAKNRGPIGKFSLIQSSLIDFQKQENEVMLRAELRRFDSQGPEAKLYLDRLQYDAKVKCIAKNDIMAVVGNASDTSALLGNLLLEKYGDVSVSRTASSMLLAKLQNTPISAVEQCPLKVVAVTRRITQRDLLYIAGVGNAFLASLERTAFDTYSVVAFKFAPYISYDPYSSQGAYLDSLHLMVQQTFLGMFVADKGKTAIFDPLPSQVPSVTKPHLLIPFSPMLASCLSITIAFSLYLLYIILIEIRNKGAALIGRIVPSIDFNKTLFTSFALVITGICAALFALVAIIEVTWGILFQ